MAHTGGLQPDLDELIGEIRREAARRRAAPDFPVDAEAVLSGQLDATGPGRPGVDLARVAAALRALATPPQGTGAADADADGRNVELVELAELTHSTLRALSTRIEALERRTERLLGPGAPVPAALDPTGIAAVPDLSHWHGSVTKAAGAGGPVLVAGPGAAAWAESLRHDGHDVYGVDPAAATDGPGWRNAAVLDYLCRVGDRSFALIALVGPVPTETVTELDRVAAELARGADTVLVISEAEWAWRRRVGPVAADRSPDRPVAAETWLAELAAAGFHAAGRFGPYGRDYCLMARLSAGPSGPATSAPDASAPDASAGATVAPDSDH